MIRNPSDGTTYELPKPAIGIPITGLPETEMAGDIPVDTARLERSREWLKNRPKKEDKTC